MRFLVYFVAAECYQRHRRQHEENATDNATVVSHDVLYYTYDIYSSRQKWGYANPERQEAYST